MQSNLKGGSPEFDNFKEEVNRKINGLTKDWWDKVDVHLHGGIYRGQVEYGIIDGDGEEDISKIVTLTAIIGYSYLNAVADGGRVINYIDTMHNKFLPSSFRFPLEDGLFNRRKFINFIDILLKHAEKTEIYRSSLDIDVDGATLKHQLSDAKDRWDRVDNDDGTVRWVLKEGYNRNLAQVPNVLPGFNVKLYEDPKAVLMSVAGPDMSGYGTIVESVQMLSEKRHFINLVILLKEFVTKAYQFEDETLDYKEMDYQVALKVVEEDIDKEFFDKYIYEQVQPGVLLLTPEALEQVNDVFITILDGQPVRPSPPLDQAKACDFLNDWVDDARSREDTEIALIESLLNLVKEYRLPDKYHAFYTPIIISHMILYEKQQVFKAKIYKKIYSQLRNFRNVSKEIIAEHYQEIVQLISELWAIMYAWHSLYRRIYKKHILESREKIFEQGHIKFDQKIKTIELGFWTQYLVLRFETTEYKDDLDLSPDPTTFKKIFARVEILKKKLEPSLSNPPLIVMPHLHSDLDGEIAERLENFKANDDLIYENEKEYIHQLRSVETYKSEIDKLVNEEKEKGQHTSNDAALLHLAESNAEYNDAMNNLDSHTKSANWMKQFLIDIVNSPEIETLILYYEALIEDNDIGPDQIPFVREFKEKYGDDVSFLYDFLGIEIQMINNALDIHNEGLPGHTDKNMKRTIQGDGNIDRLLYVNDDMKDSKDEIIPETVYADIWPERKRYLDNILKEEDKPEIDLSDLMKEGQGAYDPLQRKWISGVRDLVNPMDELKKNIFEERRSKYATTTRQGEVGIQAAQKAKRAIDFKESSKAYHQEKDKKLKTKNKQKLLQSAKAFTLHKDKLLKRTPTRQRYTIPRGIGVLENKRLWKRNGIGKDKYIDYFMTGQFRSAARDRWGDNYLEEGPQVFLDAVDLEGTQEDRLLAYKEAFQTIDQEIPLEDDEVIPAFIEEIQDIERRGDLGEQVRMVVVDMHGNPMFDRDDQRKPAEAYVGSNMMSMKSDYGTIRLNTIVDVANYNIPLKVGKTLQGEDVYHYRPFLTLYNEPIDFKTAKLGGGRRTVNRRRRAWN